MLTEFIYQWNPFNICGIKVGIEDLISNPLLPHETLMQDGYGNFRRIQVPYFHSPLWEKVVFWFQTHLNQKGHLEAIDKLITLFYQKLLQHPPQKTENLQDFNLKISQLRSLKNDYGFIYLKTGDSSFVDIRLKEIEQHAYSIFSYYYKQQILEQEEIRKKDFVLFEEQMELKFDYLAVEYFIGLIKARLLIFIPSEVLQSLFEQHVESLDNRLELIQNLYEEVNKIEKVHQGKFTIPLMNDHFHQIRMKLCNEVSKIRVEVEILIRHLILHYRLAPLKREAKMLLDLMQVDPEAYRKSQSCPFLFHEALENEIKRIRRIFKKKSKKIKTTV